MYILGFKNTSAQIVAANGTINLGTVYRKYAKKNNCGNCAFSFSGPSLGLLQQGMYELIISFVVSAPVAGNVSIQLYQNGVAIPGAVAEETITTATTELRTMTIPYIFLVNNNCLLGNAVTNELQITAVNTGTAEAIINNVSGTVKKVVY